MSEPEPETLIDRLIAALLIPLPFLPVDVPWSLAVIVILVMALIIIAAMKKKPKP